MAFTLNGPSNGGRGRFRGVSTLSEMNVVPLVDVVLVLLIIFMLTAHVMEYGLEITVPTVNRVKETVKDLPVVSLTREGDTYFNGKSININLVGEEVKRRYPGTTAVYLQADKETPFEQVAQVLAALRDANLQVNVVTQPLDETSRKRS